MSKMQIVTIDFETAYSQEYSLKKVSEVDYILDPRFEVIMCGVKLGSKRPAMVATGPAAVEATLRSTDWNQCAMLSHNARFDAAVLAWRYGIYPKLYLDTLSMANAVVRAHTGSVSLENVARHVVPELAPKGEAVKRMLGKWFANFSTDELIEYAEYCKHDVELCRTIFDRFMAAGFPRSELEVIDLALRCFIEPQARLDSDVLALHLNEVRAEKERMLASVGHLDKSWFSSNLKFKALLESHNICVPTKISPATGQEVPALARNDPDFKALCEDPTLPPKVQAILSVRLGVKSTIDETRAATLLNLARHGWSWGYDNGYAPPEAGVADTGWMPVPYRYYGAHTGRFSGDGGFNFANLRRGSELRRAIVAPDPDWRVVHRDSSQIEARLCAWLAGCTSLLDAFRDGQDVYAEFASRFYGTTVTKESYPERRFVGKTAVLGLGYGCGWARFKTVLYIGQGGVSVEVDEATAQDLVSLYRSMFHEIPKLWRRATETIAFLRKRDKQKEAPPFRVLHPIPVVEIEEELVRLPNGLAIRYPNLRKVLIEDQEQIVFDAPAGRGGGFYAKRLHGPKLVENITQALARIIVTDIMRDVQAKTGFRPFMSTYDSHDYVVPRSEVEWFHAELERLFTVAPAWAADLPLASDGGWGMNLLAAEQGVNQ